MRSCQVFADKSLVSIEDYGQPSQSARKQTFKTRFLVQQSLCDRFYLVTLSNLPQPLTTHFCLATSGYHGVADCSQGLQDWVLGLDFTSTGSTHNWLGYTHFHNGASLLRSTNAKCMNKPHPYFNRSFTFKHRQTYAPNQITENSLWSWAWQILIIVIMYAYVKTV